MAIVIPFPSPSNVFSSCTPSIWWRLCLHHLSTSLLSNNTSEFCSLEGDVTQDALVALSAMPPSLSSRPISKCLQLSKPKPHWSLFLSRTILFPQVPTPPRTPSGATDENRAFFFSFSLSSSPDTSDTGPSTTSNPRQLRLYSCPPGTSCRPGLPPGGPVRNPGLGRPGHTTSWFSQRVPGYQV